MTRLILAACSILVLTTACGDSTKGAGSASPSSAPADSARPSVGATATASAKAEAPREKSITAKFCLGADGTSQDCGISCKVDKDPETCAKWAEKTKAICAKITKAQCQDICVKDENPVACDLAKAMK